MDYYLKPSALKDIRSLSRETQTRILQKLDFYIHANNPFNFAERLRYPKLGEFKFRVGDYRIIFDVENGKIIILKIGHRRDIYK